MNGHNAERKVSEVPYKKFTSRWCAGQNNRPSPMLRLGRIFSVMMLFLVSISGAASTTEDLPSEYVFGRSAFPASNQGIAIAVGDFNGDGRPDFVSANSGLTPSLTTLVGQPNGGFVETQTVSLSVPANAGATGDFNGDGKLDIAVVTTSGISVLLGNGNGTFGAPRRFPSTDFQSA